MIWRVALPLQNDNFKANRKFFCHPKPRIKTSCLWKWISPQQAAWHSRQCSKNRRYPLKRLLTKGHHWKILIDGWCRLPKWWCEDFREMSGNGNRRLSGTHPYDQTEGVRRVCRGVPLFCWISTNSSKSFGEGYPNARWSLKDYGNRLANLRWKKNWPFGISNTSFQEALRGRPTSQP